MDEASLKSASLTEVQEVLAAALRGLTGWEKCDVDLRGLEFEPRHLPGSESVKMTLQVNFSRKIKPPRVV